LYHQKQIIIFKLKHYEFFKKQSNVNWKLRCPEIKDFDSKKLAKFSLATSETYKDKNGVKVENTEWHNIVAWGGLATIAQNYLQKGRQVAIEGKISYRSYEKDGQKLYYTEIQAHDIVLLGTANQN
jgi:single-strand DNA-binding protein